MSSGSSNANGSGGSGGAGVGPYETQLIGACQQYHLRHPTIQIVSDRRGGRTAWSATATVQGQTFQAQFWYDGNHANQAREDVAQCALQRMGLIPRPDGPSVPAVQQQQQQQSQQSQQQSPRSSQGGSQQRSLGAIGGRMAG